MTRKSFTIKDFCAAISGLRSPRNCDLLSHQVCCWRKHYFTSSLSSYSSLMTVSVGAIPFATGKLSSADFLQPLRLSISSQAVVAWTIAFCLPDFLLSRYFAIASSYSVIRLCFASSYSVTPSLTIRHFPQSTLPSPPTPRINGIS